MDGRTIRVAVIAFDQISPFHLWIPMTVFGQGADKGGRYRSFLCAERKGEIKTADGYNLSILEDFTACAGFEAGDMIIVPTWHDVEVRPSVALLELLQTAHEKGVTIIGLCLGAFVLGAAGLLDGVAATTHWAYADRFAQLYPEVLLQPDRLYIDAGSIITSAGVAAGIDCCLHVMRCQFGAQVSNRVARSMVVAPHRDGGQSQFIERPVPQLISEKRLADLVATIRQNLAQSYSIETAADRLHMSRRSFTRIFRKHMGTSFTQWLLDERLGRSQDLLENTALPIESIAEEAGFQTAASLRHHFRQKFGTPPAAWRHKFCGTNILSPD
nr:helix-turn-helix domain-containing protein [uncultured Cohaesibacter sp.]